MASTKAGNPSPITTQRYLNTASYAGDPSPGAVVSTANVSGSIIQSYGGQVGGITTMDKAEANALSDPGAFQLYPGDYQYVQFDPNATAAAAVQGQVVYWKNNTTNFLPGGGFIVSIDETATELGFVAGIALANTAKGNYWFIQVAGIAQVKFAASQGVTTPLVGDLIFADYNTPGNLAYDPVQTGNPTFAQLREVLGTLWQTTFPGAIGPVMLGIGCKYMPGGGGGEG